MLIATVFVAAGLSLVGQAQVVPSPVGLGTIEFYQVRPDRPLIVQRDRPEFFAGFEMSLDDNAGTVILANSVVMPLGVNFGFFDVIEAGGQFDLNIQPEVGADVSLRVRVAPFKTKLIGFGLALTLPLGYLTTRLGPNSLPLALEMPVLRWENIYSAFQFALRPLFNFHSGGVDFALNPAVTGIMRIDRQSFMALDAAAFAKFSPSSARFELGLSYGYIFNKEWTAKLTALTSDVSTMNNWTFVASVVNLWPLDPGSDQSAK